MKREEMEEEEMEEEEQQQPSHKRRRVEETPITIVSLPFELVKMKSETKVRVAKVQFNDETVGVIPRANLEVILSNE